MLVAVIAVGLSALAPLSGAAADSYSDIEGHTHEAAITALGERGVFDGTECGDGLFCPNQPLSRAEMAVWLIRVLRDDAPALIARSRFADVSPGEWWAPFAEDLAQRDITAGCKTGPLRYCPDDSVKRGQMATFLVRAFDLPDAPPAGFADTAGNTHASRIDALAAADVTAGCKTGPPRFCPTKSVTRGQMATFLHRASQLALSISEDVPNVNLTAVVSGERVDFRSFFDGDRAVMLWFWADW